MRKTLHRVLFILLAFTLAASLTACAAKEAPELTKVRLSEVTHSLFYAPQYAAIALGYFADEGLEIELTNAGGADGVMTAVISGDADIGFCGPEQTVYVYNQGQPDYPINFAQLTKRDGSFIIGREKVEDFDIKDLEGKYIIGGRKGGMPVMALNFTLTNHGIVPGKDVVVDTSIAFDAMTGAFISGTGDFVTAFEPTAGALEAAGHGYVLASLGTLSGEIPYTVYNARKSYIELHPYIIQGFTNAIIKGQKYVATHSAEEIAEVITSFFPDTDIATVVSVVDRYKSVDAYASSPALSEEAFERLLDILDRSGELTTRPPYHALVTNDFVD
jgi:NitT/TauT family transport system substrate-binding protein